MDKYTATELAYKNGYEKGYEAGKPKWTPVTEGLPQQWQETDFGEPIEFIVFVEGAELPTVLCFDGEFFFNIYTGDYYEVSHWMHMPEPPKRVNDGAK